MSTLGARLKSLIILFHRWMGVGFCLLFLLWFSSGMFMLYCDYPMVSRADRLEHAPGLNLASIQLTPQEALARLQPNAPPDAARINVLDGRPAYRFRFGPDELIVYADDGSTVDQFPPEMTLRIASTWSGQPPAEATLEEKDEADQWTVSGEFDPLRPLRKYSWPDGEQVYVSSVTGEVVQYTTRAARAKAFLGPIPHWLYFTPLRKHADEWSRIVIAASGAAVIAAVLGIVVGAWTYSPTKRYLNYKGPSSIPYAGPKRWHMVLGLVFGPLACTWAFSGMLSMDPFPSLSGNSGMLGVQVAQALRGRPEPMFAFVERTPGKALLEVGPAFRTKELEMLSIAGEPAYLLTAGPNQTRIVPVHGPPIGELDSQTVMERLNRAAGIFEPMQIRLITRYEAYYLDRKGSLPLPVISVQLNDPRHSAFYIDPKTARIVKEYDSQSRWNRWLYHGLHSLDFPWLYSHRPVWDIAILALLLGGAALCITSTILAWNVARRTLRRVNPTL